MLLLAYIHRVTTGNQNIFENEIDNSIYEYTTYKNVFIFCFYDVLEWRKSVVCSFFLVNTVRHIK